MADTQIQLINQEINLELKDPSVGAALLATTFKGLNPVSMKQALMEGMIRGFKFKDFLEKNIYAISYGNGYSLMTSIDYARKVGARSGVVGKNSPVYVMDGSKIVSCSVTIKKRFTGGYIGDFTAEVYFDEYDKGANLWKSKPRTMIAKVAEMHALRMACPEELSQTYIEEEINEDNASQTRFNSAKVETNSIRMGNIIKNGENKKAEENQDGVTDAEGAQASPKDDEPEIK